MAKNSDKKRQNSRPAVKTQSKKSHNKKGKKQTPLNAEELDRQLFTYMGESGKKVVLDDQLDNYFKKPAE